MVSQNMTTKITVQLAQRRATGVDMKRVIGVQYPPFPSSNIPLESEIELSGIS